MQNHHPAHTDTGYVSSWRRTVYPWHSEPWSGHPVFSQFLLPWKRYHSQESEWKPLHLQDQNSKIRSGSQAAASDPTGHSCVRM